MLEAPDISLIGPYPPPFGGISVHLKRLGALLTLNGYSWRQYDTCGGREGPAEVTPIRGSRAAWLARYVLTARERLVHIHGMDNLIARGVVFPLRLLRRRKVALSIHNMRVLGALDELGRAERLYVRSLLRSCSAVHVVNQALEANAINLGVPPERVFTYPAFLPPLGSPPVLPEPVSRFISGCSPSIVAIGNTATWNGHSVYGLDMLVDLLVDLRESAPSSGLLLIVPKAHDVDYGELARLRQHAIANRVADRLMVLPFSEECYPALARSDIFIRPTTTDGDAVSVREALWFGTPVVASDAVVRPPGVHTFEARNREAFASAVLEAWESSGPRPIERLPQGNPSSLSVLAMYRNLLALDSRG